MKKAVMLLLGFATGLGAGLFLRYGYAVLMDRSGRPGGEVLIPVLILLLVFYGFTWGRLSTPMDAEWHPLPKPEEASGISATYMDGYIEGYEDGYQHGMADIPDEAV